MKLDRCGHEDYLCILSELDDFWGSDRTRNLHHPMFVHEFGDTSWVVREENEIIAYLFAVWSQTEPIGYIHLVGVRRAYQRRGIGSWLYGHFESLARQRGCKALKAVTAPLNRDSIAFHRSLGFSFLGGPGQDGVPVVPDYFGPGQSRVLFWKELDN